MNGRWLFGFVAVCVVLTMLAGPARADRVAYTDEGAFLSGLASMGYAPVFEGFESDAAWGGVRTTIVGGPMTAPSITHLGLTWTANNADGEVTTGSGPARSGMFGFFTLPHGDFDAVPFVPDGFVASSVTMMFAAGGWIETNTPFAEVDLILDGDLMNPVNLPGNAGTVGTAHVFLGVIDTAGFTAFEVRETDGTPDDQKFIFADDFTFGFDATQTVPGPSGLAGGVLLVWVMVRRRRGIGWGKGLRPTRG